MDKESRRKFIQQTGALAGGAFAAGLTPAAAASTPKLSRTQKLRARLQQPGILIAPEAFTPVTAKIAEANGFEAIYIGGSMMSATYLTVPDWGVINPTDMAQIAGRIAREVSIPAIVDADQAGETALQVYRTVQEYERAGIAAMHMEDSLNPKHADQRSGFAGTPSASHVQSLERMLLRIKAAVDARSDPDFVIIARTDEQELDQIIRRGNAFAKAGADVFMAEWLRSYKVEQIDRIAREVPLPLLGINLPKRQIENTGLKINIFTGIVSGPAMALSNTIYRELKQNQEVQSLPERRLPEELRNRVMNWDTYAKLSEQWRATP
ncbi:MAG: isocitrate lyase/PEP mutase family protein, partial [Acidobacteria bacterium]|nr:isocitrate lyase/PEP mutase family protein [Acidobacteriota bacterium]